MDNSLNPLLGKSRKGISFQPDSVVAGENTPTPNYANANGNGVGGGGGAGGSALPPLATTTTVTPPLLPSFGGGNGASSLPQLPKITTPRGGGGGATTAAGGGGGASPSLSLVGGASSPSSSSTPMHLNLQQHRTSQSSIDHVNAFLARHHATHQAISGGGGGGAMSNSPRIGGATSSSSSTQQQQRVHPSPSASPSVALPPLSSPRAGAAAATLQGSQMLQQAKVLDLSSPSGLVSTVVVPSPSSSASQQQQQHRGSVGGGGGVLLPSLPSPRTSAMADSNNTSNIPRRQSLAANANANVTSSGSGGGSVVVEDPNVILATIAASDHFLGMKDFFAPPHTDSIVGLVVDSLGAGRIYTSSYDDSVGVCVMNSRERVGTLPHSDWVNAIIVVHIEGVAPAAVGDAGGGGGGGGKKNMNGHLRSFASSISTGSRRSDNANKNAGRSDSNLTAVFHPSSNKDNADSDDDDDDVDEGGGGGSTRKKKKNATPPTIVASYIITGSEDGHVTFWSPSTSRVVHQLTPCHGAPITSLCAHDDVLFAASLRSVFVINITSGVLLRTLNEPAADVLCMAFIDGFLFTGLTDGRVVLWDVVGEFVVREIPAHGPAAVGPARTSPTPSPPTVPKKGGGVSGAVAAPATATTAPPPPSGVRCILAPTAPRIIVPSLAGDGHTNVTDSGTSVGGTTSPSASAVGSPLPVASSSPSSPSSSSLAAAAKEAAEVKATAASFRHTFFTAGDDGLIKMWAISAGVCLKTIRFPQSPSPMGTMKAAGKDMSSGGIRALAHHYRGTELFIFAASGNAKISCHGMKSDKHGIIHSALVNTMAVWHDPLNSAAEPMLVVGDHSGLLQLLPILNPEANVIAGTCIV